MRARRATLPQRPILWRVQTRVFQTTDNITSDTTPTLSGSGLTAGDYVYIYDGATLIGAALVDGSGNWTWTLTPGDTTLAGAPADQIDLCGRGYWLKQRALTRLLIK
jgi:hypothetical protein